MPIIFLIVSLLPATALASGDPLVLYFGISKILALLIASVYILICHKPIRIKMQAMGVLAIEGVGLFFSGQVSYAEHIWLIEGLGNASLVTSIILIIHIIRHSA